MAVTVQTILKQAKANRQMVGVTLGSDSKYGRNLSAQVEDVGNNYVQLFVVRNNEQGPLLVHKHNIRQVRNRGVARNTRARFA